MTSKPNLIGGGFLSLLIVGLTMAAPPLHTVSIGIDGRDELRISGGSMVVEHMSWSHPSSLEIDDVPHAMAWNGNTSNPIPVPMTGNYWVKKTLGRDTAYAVQRSNGYALAIVDNPNGGDFYQFDFHAAPEQNTTDWMYVAGAGGTPGRMEFAGTPGYSPHPSGSQTTISLTIDGSDEVMFVDGNMVIRHMS